MRSLRWIIFLAALVLTFACVLPGSTTSDNEPQIIDPPLPLTEEQTPIPVTVEQQPRFCSENQGRLLFTSDEFAYPETGANYDIYAANDQWRADHPPYGLSPLGRLPILVAELLPHRLRCDNPGREPDRNLRHERRWHRPGAPHHLPRR